MRCNRVGLAGAFLALLLAAGAASATTVRPLGLDEIIDTAAVVFEGTCVGNWSGRDAQTQLVVTYTTFAVKDVLKGDVPTNYVIKQIGGSLPNGMIYRAHGVPSFTQGQDYVVFLAGVSSAGFSSPIGLAQGKFDVLPGAAGPEVTNGRDFRNMTAGMATAVLPAATAKSLGTAQAPVRRLGLDEFKQMVRAQLGAKPR